MYSIKYTSEVIYVQSSLSENVLLVYSWALYLLKVSLRWRPLSIRSFVVFGLLSFFLFLIHFILSKFFYSSSSAILLFFSSENIWNRIYWSLNV